MFTRIFLDIRLDRLVFTLNLPADGKPVVTRDEVRGVLGLDGASVIGLEGVSTIDVNVRLVSAWNYSSRKLIYQRQLSTDHSQRIK